MQLKKIVLGDMERCYCASHITRGGQQIALLASEAVDGPCFAYHGANFETKETVWENGGGTMSMVELPWSSGDFLATQRFFPGFRSEESKVVLCQYVDEKWVVRDFLALPFLHRFDILKAGDCFYFVACTLCGSKKDREDWSDPGKLWVGELSTNLDMPPVLHPIAENLTKNHGYWRGQWQGQQACFISCESGVYAAVPPQLPGDDWAVHHIFDDPVSDMALFDFDGDGVDELAVIEPFHGDSFRILKQTDGGYREVYRYPGEIDFAHALWAGTLAGCPAVLCGVRRKGGELFCVTYQPEENAYHAEVLDTGVGTANVDVLHQEGRDVIISANHTKNEAALYFVAK